MRLDIISDTICPWCFIGKRRLERALSMRPALDIEIAWRPFQLNPDMPVEGMDRASYVARKFGGPERAERIYQNLVNAGAGENIPFHFDLIRRTPNTLASHRLIRWAEGANVQDRVVEGLFRGYFLEGADIGDHQELTRIAAAAGMDAGAVADLFANGVDQEIVQSEDRFARDIGVEGVPCFIVNGKYAISGAQDAEVLLQVFDLALREAAEEAPVEG